MVPFNPRCYRFFLVLLISWYLVACDKKNEQSEATTLLSSPQIQVTAPAIAAVASLDFAIKTFHFKWADVSDATFYRLLEKNNTRDEYKQIGTDFLPDIETYSHQVALYQYINASYILQSCNQHGCIDSAPIQVADNLAKAVGYIKSTNTDAYDYFGYSVSISGDGDTLAVGAAGESSHAIGVNGKEHDNSAPGSGAVYVFVRMRNYWTRQAYIKASNTDIGDGFGSAVKLNGDGNILAVGAPGEDSQAVGINALQSDNSAASAGAVYLFARSGNDWSQQSYIKASNTNIGDHFGQALSMSLDGQTLAVAAIDEDSNAIGINGDQTNNNATSSGAVYVFTQQGAHWKQQAYIKASNTDKEDQFGKALSLSGDARTLVVGAYLEDSRASGINGEQTDNSVHHAGAVYVFVQAGKHWQQQAYIKSSDTALVEYFGRSLSVNGDGSTLVVGADFDSQKGTTAMKRRGSLTRTGLVYVFNRVGSNWIQQGKVMAGRIGVRDNFGTALSLNQDGNILAVGADFDNSNAKGVNGDAKNNLTSYAGAVYIFERVGEKWHQQAYVKASNTDWYDDFGGAVSISADGKTLAVGASEEDSNARGVSGEQVVNQATNSGAVYLY